MKDRYGADVRLKYIIFKLDGKTFFVHFKENLTKGIHDVNIWVESTDIILSERKDAEIKDAYPSLKKVIEHLLWASLPHWLVLKLSRR